MKSVTVIPLDKGIFRDELTYFSAQDVNIGSIVSVPVKNRQVDALVVGLEDASKIKSALRNSSFPLKKITKIKQDNLFLPSFLSAVKQTADYFAVSRGQVIKNFVPKIILEQERLKNFSAGKDSQVASSEDSSTRPLRQNKFVLQDSDDERLAYYKSLIRESFARKHSVFFCLPTISDIEHVVSSLEKGIKEYTVVLHSHLTKKEIITNWQAVLQKNHPVLIVATPLFLSLPKSDIKTYIIDRENSAHYKEKTRPFIDARTFAEFYAVNSEARFVFGDAILRVETLRRTDRSELTPISPLKYRSLSNAKSDIDYLIKSEANDEPFVMLGPKIRELITASQEANEQLIIYVHRKGSTPVTVCKDCGQVAICNKCQMPLVIHQTDREGKHLEKNLFICHYCGEIRNAEDTCRHCGSWRLALLGIGIERMEEEIKRLFPNTTVFRLDTDIAKPEKKIPELIGKFRSAPGSVLIGTEALIYHLDGKVENLAVASIDSRLAIPGFRTRERVFNLLLRLRALATKRFVIQTRNTEETLFDYVNGGQLLDFYREEIADRKTYYYPPFCLMIKISHEGKRAAVQLAMKKLEKLLAEYEPIVFPSFGPEINGRYKMEALIKLDPKQWPEKQLLEVLRSLPPSFIINIDPEDIL